VTDVLLNLHDVALWDIIKSAFGIILIERSYPKPHCRVYQRTCRANSLEFI
jgi:hypothetical protein